jgi:hypothetical protein
MQGTCGSAGIGIVIFTSELDGGEWLASGYCRFVPVECTLRYALNGRLGGPRSRPGHFGEERNLLPGLEPRLFGCSARSPVSTPATLLHAALALTTKVPIRSLQSLIYVFCTTV